MQVAFIVNSNSVRARRTLGALRHTAGHGHTYLLTTHPGAARELAVDCCVSGFTHVIVLGGDGTLNEVVDGLMSLARSADQLPILSFIPCGTGNDFARNFGITSDIAAFMRRLESGQLLFTDIGTVEIMQSDAPTVLRHFINVMDMGLGGVIAQKVNGYSRSKWSFLAYQRGIINTLPFYKKTRIECNMEGYRYEGPVLSIVVANGKWFGNGIGIAPLAAVNSGRLSVVVLGRIGMLDYLLQLPELLRCKKIRHREIVYQESNEVFITGETTAIEVDGEYAGRGPCRVGIIPAAIRLLV